jgi:thioredoxin reductase (NADPH)
MGDEASTATTANGITLYGTNWCPDCKRSKRFLGEQRVPYTFVDIENDPDGQAAVERLNAGKQIIPTIVFPDGGVLVEPSNAELAARLGIQTQAQCDFYDLIVVGGGPAGLTAAIYAAREGLDTLVIERSGLGGQAGITERLDNYPGFPEGVTGAEFAERLVAQAQRFGVELLGAQTVTGLGVDEMRQYRYVQTADGRRYECSAILLAPGSRYRRLGVPGEEDFIGAGVHFCATCDGPFYRGKELVVIGGGNSAAEEGFFLTTFAPKVTVLVRGPALSATKVVADKVTDSPRMEVRLNTVVDEFRGEGSHLSGVVVRDTTTGTREELHPAGVFVFVGLEPNTEFLRGVVDLDERGFILTDATLRTSTPGIFAAGDARHGSTKQLVSAAGEGATAILMIREHLNVTRSREQE